MAEPAPRQLILTLYGLYARDEHNWLSVSAVVRLMGDLGVDSAGVRSSISRLKRRGVLQAMKMDGAAGYALSDDALELLREGDVRIFSRQRAVEADGLVMVVFSIPESERDKRHQLRSTLVSMGFGTVSPGVWVAPGLLHDEVARTLEHQGLAPFVDLFRARYDGFGSLRDRVGEWWDLPAIEKEYAEFLAKYAGAHARWKASAAASRTAFETYVAMLTDWRRLPYLDPGLPLELLPPGWNGSKAAELFADLDALLRNPAREYAFTTIHA
jgi:phenylacetic acid degradation operon negative regulatory protein